MDNLMLLHARNYKGNICTVGADLHTVLTVAVAGKASSAVCSAFILFCQISLTVRDNLFIRHLKDILGKISSDNSLCSLLSVPDAFYYSSRSEEAVSHCIHALKGGFQCILIYLRTLSGIQGNTVCFIEAGRNLLAYCCDYSICRNLYDLICLNNASAAAGINIAQNHLLQMSTPFS